MIQAVIVVPMFAPMIAATACDRVICAELTRLTIMTVAAEDDWMVAVSPQLASMPWNRLPVVIAGRNVRSRPPKYFCSPLLKMFSP